jgi:hypothetical protein
MLCGMTEASIFEESYKRNAFQPCREAQCVADQAAVEVER